MKLKPCPHCGKQLLPVEGGYPIHPKDNCVNRHKIVAPDEYRRWNSRPGEQAAREEVLKLATTTLDTIIKIHRDNPLSFNKMRNRAREVEFARDQICNNYHLKFDKLIEAENAD